MAFVLDEEMQNVTNIKVIGVGGGGGNAVNRMVESGLSGVEFVAMNTDQQALLNSKATQKVQLGAKLTQRPRCRRGPRGGPARRRGKQGRDRRRAEGRADGRSSPPVWAAAPAPARRPLWQQTAHDLGILTVGIVTKPFAFEGQPQDGAWPSRALPGC